MALIIRKASEEDAEIILELIDGLAEFEKLEPPDEDAKKRLINDAFPRDGSSPKYYVLLAEYDGEIAGYAFYLFTYSSFLAKPTLYLEDVFIPEQFRNKGIGTAFMNKLTEIGKENECGRFEWCVLDWNKNAIKFYEKLGAKRLNEWLYYRIDLKK